jgi:hypothetical protein
MGCSLTPSGTCSRFHLVLVHAENDDTMPWNETESLFLSTLRAAKDASPNDDDLKNLQVVDLGEAGRQEVWQSSTRSISKTIAKHGGTYSPMAAITVLPCQRACAFRLLLDRIAPRPSNNFKTCSTSFITWLQHSLCFLRKGDWSKTYCTFQKPDMQASSPTSPHVTDLQKPMRSSPGFRSTSWKQG